MKVQIAELKRISQVNKPKRSKIKKNHTILRYMTARNLVEL